MKCTLPEPSEYPSRRETDDTIRELWKVLRLVEEMREASNKSHDALVVALREHDSSSYGDFMDYYNKAEELGKEIDEWFNDLRRE